jgi:hypothetical protein
MKDLAGQAQAASNNKIVVGTRKWNSQYDVTRKYQLQWAAKLPWSEAVLKDDGLIHLVQCKICSTIGKKDCVMHPKWDTLSKHGQRECHKRKAFLYAARQPSNVYEQI